MDTGMQQPKKRKRKYRKSTHAILKEEKEALAAEIETLTARLESLKSTTFGAQMEEDDEKNRRCMDKLVENRLLRRAVYIQQDNFTSVHALTNAYSLTDMEVGSSLHRFIHLDKDENSRRATLAAIKPEIIARGLQLLQRRKPQAHQPWRPMRNDHCFEASTGDYYVSSFAVMPFKRLKTARKAFEALIVRNDTDPPDCSIDAKARLMHDGRCQSDYRVNRHHNDDDQVDCTQSTDGSPFLTPLVENPDERGRRENTEDRDGKQREDIVD
ncbi:hypothetical protein PC117_g25420 [Phytophthora cactorum]|uniref:Uncharacterized protein n=1 Tax=Phytophthora cactorum TaxID=29920 RepID=A0A8T1ASH1_9STRA|nr:hypothetical protein PC117_g25420 [Phytophthora cactorum]